AHTPLCIKHSPQLGGGVHIISTMNSERFQRCCDYWHTVVWSLKLAAIVLCAVGAISHHYQPRRVHRRLMATFLTYDIGSHR
ncbi:MAG: hypothetical protein LRY40_02215, partial [Shewanella fodinae]|nr:hypothetical protein [Shewanella fodinae]